jgi:sphingolipid delta-4 desaturase
MWWVALVSHNLGSQKMQHNRLFSLFANLPVGVPSSVSFKRYHMDHHKYQGEDGIDVDIPTVWKGRICNTRIAKALFILFQVAFYALRPMIVNPKKPTRWEFINVTTALSFDLAVYLLWGPSALGFLLLSSVLGSGMHPVAGHFIAEHYVFVKGVETYSYYGWLNIFAFNVGYHNEHHDFPFIPGSRLPLLRAMASEFYDTLPQHKSWIKVLVDYIMDPEVGAFSRVKRQRLDNAEMKRLKPQ